MDGTKLHAKIYYGRSKVAQHIGLACNVYRPVIAADPLTNWITTLPAAFNLRDPKYLKADDFGKSAWYADYDGTQTQPGDYLVRQSDGAIWYVSQQGQLLPIAMIQCERKLYITRPQPDSATAVGAQPYSGEQPSNTDDVLGTPQTMWPASILLGGRALNALPLPMSTKEGGWRICLPGSVPIVIQSSDVMTDDLNRRFVVESAELTDLGWRINANEAHD